MTLLCWCVMLNKGKEHLRLRWFVGYSFEWNVVFKASTDGIGLCVSCNDLFTAHRSTVILISSELGFGTMTGLEHHSTGPVTGSMMS